MNPFDLACIGAALDGCYDPLAEHIKEGGEITPAMRQLLAQVLLGERKLPKHRPVRNKTVDRKIEMARGVMLLEREGTGTEEAVNIIAGHYKVNSRTIWRALKAGRYLVEFRFQMDADPEVKALLKAQRERRRNQPHLPQQYYHPVYSSLEMVEFYLREEEREAAGRQKNNPDKK
jgi:hypothetical protein